MHRSSPSPLVSALRSSNQHFSFYDLIVTKARGKSGPLFHFDVHDDIRLVHDTRIEKDESHPGKVCRMQGRLEDFTPAARRGGLLPEPKRAFFVVLS